jgi:hypothetical protein
MLETYVKLEIPLHAQVECSDGICGRSEYVLINPVLDQVTYVVVKKDSSPNTEYVVPIESVFATIADTIQLSCSKAELEQMEPFVHTKFVQKTVPDYSAYRDGVYGMGQYYFMPYVAPEITEQVLVEHQHIPAGELAVRRGTHVHALDGHVGHVDEFVVNPENSHITHLVMREGHLCGQRDVFIPLSALGETHDDTVFLKIDKEQVEALPSFPVHRRWA